MVPMSIHDMRRADWLMNRRTSESLKQAKRCRIGISGGVPLRGATLWLPAKAVGAMFPFGVLLHLRGGGVQQATATPRPFPQSNPPRYAAFNFSPSFEMQANQTIQEVLCLATEYPHQAFFWPCESASAGRLFRRPCETGSRELHCAMVAHTVLQHPAKWPREDEALNWSCGVALSLHCASLTLAGRERRR